MIRAFCSDNKCTQLCMSMNNNKSQERFFDDVTLKYDEEIKMISDIISCNYY